MNEIIESTNSKLDQQCTFGAVASFPISERSEATYTINVCTDLLEKAINQAIAALVADWDRITSARAESRAGGGRLLDEILADATRPPYDRSATRPGGA